jgi:hypoxanthine phosphoribosyltransferase
LIFHSTIDKKYINDIKGKNVLLIDEFVNTGGSFEEVSNSIKNISGGVSCVAIYGNKPTDNVSYNDGMFSLKLYHHNNNEIESDNPKYDGLYFYSDNKFVSSKLYKKGLTSSVIKYDTKVEVDFESKLINESKELFFKSLNEFINKGSDMFILRNIKIGNDVLNFYIVKK